MRTAVIGCGFQGSIHAASVAQNTEASLVVCCDEDPDRAFSVAQSTGADNWSTDWETVISDSRVEAVVIATPTYNHAQLAISAAGAGKHVLLEKPMATSVEDCLRIEKAVADSGVRMLIGFKFRFAPAVREAKEAVPRPTVMNAHTLYDASQPTSDWVNDRSLSGGRLMSSLVHSVDLLRYLSGSEAIRVTAEGGILAATNTSGPHNAVATIRFANGSIASVLHGTAGSSPLLSTWSFQLAAKGRNATVFDHARRMKSRHDGINSIEFVDPVEDPFATGMQQLMDCFVTAARDGTPDSPGPRDGTMSVLICRLIEEAITTGEPQEVLPPEPTG